MAIVMQIGAGSVALGADAVMRLHETPLPEIDSFPYF
jgi:hypothetical protein